MKNILLAGTALVALSASAFAADLPARSAPALAPAPVFTWAGLYVGGTVGAVASRTSYDMYDVWDWEGYGTGYGNAPAPTGKNAALGVIGGAHIGYNLQSGALVYGIEADFAFAGGKGQSSFYYVDDYTQTFGVSSELRNLGTVRARLGYAFGNTLAYVTGGYAYGSVGVKGSIVGHSSTAKTMMFSDSSVRSGYVLGGGLEHAVTDHVTVRAEALYANLGSKNVNEKTNYYGQAMSIPTKTDALLARVGMSYKW